MAAAGAGHSGSPASSPQNTCFHSHHSLFLPSENQKSAKHLVLVLTEQSIQCFLPEVTLQFKMYSIFISNYLKWLKKISSSKRECVLKRTVLGTARLITWSSCRSPGNCSRFFPGKKLFWRHQRIPGEYCLFLTPLAWYLKDHVETCGSFQWLENNAAGFTISHNGLLQWKKKNLNHKPATGPSASYRNKRVAGQNTSCKLRSIELLD